jgi:uncharacterized membrane protein
VGETEVGFGIGGERVEFSINGKQAIAIVWTIIALVVSLIIVFALGYPSYGTYGSVFGGPWQWLVALFFGLFLVITVPVYLLIALWHIVSKLDST